MESSEWNNNSMKTIDCFSAQRGGFESQTNTIKRELKLQLLDREISRKTHTHAHSYVHPHPHKKAQFTYTHGYCLQPLGQSFLGSLRNSMPPHVYCHCQSL